MEMDRLNSRLGYHLLKSLISHFNWIRTSSHQVNRQICWWNHQWMRFIKLFQMDFKNFNRFYSIRFIINLNLRSMTGNETTQSTISPDSYPSHFNSQNLSMACFYPHTLGIQSQTWVLISSLCWQEVQVGEDVVQCRSNLRLRTLTHTFISQPLALNPLRVH